MTPWLTPHATAPRSLMALRVCAADAPPGPEPPASTQRTASVRVVSGPLRNDIRILPRSAVEYCAEAWKSRQQQLGIGLGRGNLNENKGLHRVRLRCRRAVPAMFPTMGHADMPQGRLRFIATKRC